VFPGGRDGFGGVDPAAVCGRGSGREALRHKVLALLRQRGLVSQERIDLLNSWRRSGFSVHNRVFVPPRDGREFEALVRYMMRPAVSLARLRFTPGSHEVVYPPKAGHGTPRSTTRPAWSCELAAPLSIEPDAPPDPPVAGVDSRLRSTEHFPWALAHALQRADQVLRWYEGTSVLLRHRCNGGCGGPGGPFLRLDDRAGE
jgi:hypothetical protein